MGLIAAAMAIHAQSLQGAALVRALQHGGFVIVMRHPNSPMTPPAKDQLNADNLNGERQLDAEGIASALAMGKALRELKIPIGEVLSSPTYRALETVKYAQFGAAKTVPELGEDAKGMQGGSDAMGVWLRDRVKKLPVGTNTICITHFPNLRSAWPELAQSGTSVAEGEALIFGSDGKGGSALVARVKIDEWPKLAQQ
jgi:phosphohistidine phosphatase SixA